MADLEAIRARLATLVAEAERHDDPTATLPASPYELDNIQPPFAFVSLGDAAYVDIGEDGMDLEFFTITVAVSRANDVNAQKTLDAYMAARGPSSIKARIEADRNLADLVDRVRIRRRENAGGLVIAGQEFYGAQLAVEVRTRTERPRRYP